MKKISSTLLIVATLVVGGSLTLSTLAYAQTVAAITPTFYTQSGAVVNSGGSSVLAGYYYLANGNSVYYYGNGTYYNTNTQLYGGYVFGSYVYPTTTSTGATPVFFNQSGQMVNPGGTALPIGYYYLQNGNQIYYYGNGTYYNPTTQLYGGSVSGGINTTTVGAPNTGMGGQVSINLLILATTALIFIGASMYVSRRETILA